MIVLDTNVVSELMRPRPNAAATTWIARQPPQTLWTTCITMAEVFYGIALLPDGRRKADLAADAQRMFQDDFRRRLLAFDVDAAPHYGELLAKHRRGGKAMSILDAQIAAIRSRRRRLGRNPQHCRLHWLRRSDHQSLGRLGNLVNYHRNSTAPRGRAPRRQLSPVQ